MESRKDFFRGSDDVKKKPQKLEAWAHGSSSSNCWSTWCGTLGKRRLKPWRVVVQRMGGSRRKRCPKAKGPGLFCSRLIFFLCLKHAGVVSCSCSNFFSSKQMAFFQNVWFHGSKNWRSSGPKRPHRLLATFIFWRTGSTEVKIALTSMYLRSMDGIFTSLYLRNQRNVY